ncbi:MAG: carbohydrate ABC transporter permease [Candidatus Bipolaricaulia bacterium]
MIRKLKGTIRPSIPLFLGPSVILVLIFYFVPIALTITMAFTRIDQTFTWELIGLDNFRRLIGNQDPLIFRIVKNTVVYVVATLPMIIGGALLISLLSWRMGKRARILFRTIFFLPRMFPPVVWAFLWIVSFEGTRYGVFNSALGAFGISPIHWFIRYPMTAVILANGFLGIALAMLIFSSSIESIPQDYIWAAEVDGASFWQLSRYIVIPLLKWPIATMTIWHLMSMTNSYEYILLITNGGPYFTTEVWALYGYHSAFQTYQYGYGSSLMTVLMGVNLVLFVIVWKVFGIRRLLRPSGVEV